MLVGTQYPLSVPRLSSPMEPAILLLTDRGFFFASLGLIFLSSINLTLSIISASRCHLPHCGTHTVMDRHLTMVHHFASKNSSRRGFEPLNVRSLPRHYSVMILTQFGATFRVQGNCLTGHDGDTFVFSLIPKRVSASSVQNAGKA